MEFLDRKATIIFSQILDSLNGGEHRKIENDPFMPLIIERLSEGINTLWGKANTYSLCHYYGQNGDLLQDPEVCFFVVDKRNGFLSEFDNIIIVPISFQQANLGIYEESVPIERFTVTNYNWRQQKEHTEFANGWLINIESQGFLKKIRNEK